MKYQHLLVILSVAVGIPSYVTSKNYSALETSHTITTSQNDRLQIDNQSLFSSNAEANAKNEVLQKKIDQLVNDTTRVGSEIRSIKNKNLELSNLNTLLEESYAKCLKGSQSEMTQLM